MHVDRFGTECFVESRRDEGATLQRCDRRATKYSAEQAASSGRRAYSDRLLGWLCKDVVHCFDHFGIELRPGMTPKFLEG